MTKALCNGKRMLFLLFLSLCGGYCHAETLELTSKTGYLYNFSGTPNVSVEAAFTSKYPQYTNYRICAFQTLLDGTTATAKCVTPFPGGNNRPKAFWWAGTYWSNTTGTVEAVYECPSGQNWTLNGSTCIRPDCQGSEVRDPADGICKAPSCPSGTINNGTECVPDCQSASQDPDNGPIDIGTRYAGIGSTGNPPGVLCLGQCQYVPATSGGGGGDQLKIESGCYGVHLPGTASVKYYCSGTWKMSGLRCKTSPDVTGVGTPIEDAPMPEATSPGDNAAKCIKAGQGFGTVNGVVVCDGVPTTNTGTTSSGSSSSSSGSETTNGPDGPTTTTFGENGSTKTETTCDGERCTTKTDITTTDTETGDTKTTTTTTTTSQSEYCEKNPKASQCAGSEDGESDFELGTVPEEGGVTSKAFGVSSISPVDLQQNDTCPAAIPLPYGSLSWECRRAYKSTQRCALNFTQGL